VLGFFWQALVGGAAALLKNQPRNQLATLIPFRANGTGATATDTFATSATSCATPSSAPISRASSAARSILGTSSSTLPKSPTP
jgi:hypothetical protein